jgi:mono/diheme cytochrome c family protein
MRKTFILSAVALFAVAALMLVGFLDVVSTNADSAAQPATGKDPKVARGEYLVSFGMCDDCHSPKLMTAQGPVPDKTRRLSGHPAGSKLPPFKTEDIGPGKWVLFSDDFTAAVGPWGVTCSANLTPDENTGLGLWTEEMFVNAMRTGKHMGAGRPIMPPMPWFQVAELTDEDLKAVFAYLKSLPPVKNAVPAPMTLDDYAAMNKLNN